MAISRRKVSAWDATLAVDEQGPADDAAPAVLVLHSEEGPLTAGALAAGLAQENRVLLPYHPGFGGQSRVTGADRPRDLAYLYLDLLDTVGMTECVAVGTSLGAWIALEMAAMEPRRFAALVTISPVGLKFGGYLDRTFREVLVDDPARITEALYHDVTSEPWHDRKELDDIVARAEHRESFMHYVWEPYLHNPGLLSLLPRVTPPTLVLSGSHDQLVAPDYFPALAAALPNAATETVEDAGHYPDIEQPAQTLEYIRKFLSGPNQGLASHGHGRDVQQ